MVSSKSDIPKGSLVLVTGANGFIGAEITRQFLALGYRVRGTARDLERCKWLVEDVFRKETADGTFELAIVPNISKVDAFKDALKGVSAVIHVATPFQNFDPDPHAVIPPTIDATVNLLKNAAEVPSLKSFVYTSSIVAAVLPTPDEPFVVNRDSWNEAAIQLAWAPPLGVPEKAMYTYQASKAEAEKAFFKFIKDEKPSWRGNSVLPTLTLGPMASNEQSGTTNQWLWQMWSGDATPALINPASKHEIHAQLLRSTHLLTHVLLQRFTATFATSPLSTSPPLSTRRSTTFASTRGRPI
jgi:nucleoside-diphosphate-sugar epimerase